MTRDDLLPIPVDPRNSEASPAALAARTLPNERFFVRSHSAPPAVDPRSWRLDIAGRVGRPTSWTLAELEALPQARVAAVLECAGNGRGHFRTSPPGELRWGDGAVGSAVWEGVDLASLLAEVRPRSSADHLAFEGETGREPPSGVPRFVRGLSLASNEVPHRVLVALRMNGRPLAAEHGFPARLVVPGWYGMAWVKWLRRVIVRPTAFRGHYQTSRYVYQYTRHGRPIVEPVARVRVKSLLLDPAPGARIGLGRRCRIRGKAWSGSGPVDRVEVDVGGGWTPAEVSGGDGPYDWAGWTYEWTPRTRGPVRLRTRATDRSGSTQPVRPFRNVRQYGYNAIASVSVRVV